MAERIGVMVDAGCSKVHKGSRIVAPCSLLVAAVFSAGAAEALSLEEVVDKVQATYQGIEDLQARFQQTTTNRAINRILEASGAVYMKRPGKMRWEYQKPEERLYVSDGKLLWAYAPEEGQVIVQEVAAAFSSSTPLNFLAGVGNLREDFTIAAIENAATRAGKAYLLDLKPRRPEMGFSRMILEVNLQTFTIERATLLDVYANTNAFAFRGVKVNGGLADSLFQFSPPPGVTVVKPGVPSAQ